MIDYAIRTRLLAVSAVTALVGTDPNARIFPLELPQRAKPEWPAITYQIVSGRPEYHIDAVAGLAEIRLQIDCWSAKRSGKDAYDEVRVLAEAVRVALSGYVGTIGSDVVQACFLVNRRSLYDDAAQLHRESLDFEVAYSEA